MKTHLFHFEKASKEHEGLIFKWLAEPHMQEFWDNSDEHKEDIKNFIHGRKQCYFYGTTQYWIGYTDNQPFCFILTDEIHPSKEMSETHRAHLSKTGHTYCLDFGIGNTAYLGKKLAAITLNAFMCFFKNKVDPLTESFFIDPDENNPRAMDVYEKTGFKSAGRFIAQEGAFKNHQLQLMIFNFNTAE